MAPPASRDITYDPHAYPEATRLLDDSLPLGSERYPLAGQDASVMTYVLAAFHKVYGALDALVAAERI